MSSENKTKAQLIDELSELQKKIKELETPFSIEEAVFSSEEKFSRAFHCNPDPITITTLREGRYVEVNNAFLEVSGYKRHEVIGRTVFDLDIWVNIQARDLLIQELREKGFIRRDEETQFCNKEGEIRDYLFSTEIISINKEPHLLWVARDISDRKKMEEALFLSEDKFSKAFNASPISMSITSLVDERITAFNDAFCGVLGYSRHEILGRTSLDFGFWTKLDNRALIKKKILEKESIRDMEIHFFRKDGEKRLGLYSAEAIDIDGEPCMLSIVTDITEKNRAEIEIKYLSFHDKLTGLYNRAFFEEALKRLDTERKLPLSLIMGDVNGLKLINDVLGHQEGDKLLITVANLLKDSCRREDIVARWGGDEFIILLPECNYETASIILGQIKINGEKINSLPIKTSISLGLSSKISSDQDVREILKEAEDKMYRHKLLEDRSTRSSFLTSLEKTLWSRSHETQEHCRRMQEMTLKLGQAINLPDSELDNLRLLATLHDIGKIAISSSILDNPGELTQEEWAAIKKHPEIGYRIALSSPEMAPIAESILYHHEHWDGTGYPLGIKGEEIPILSRILTIADCYDVMINGRPYQKAVSHEEAWIELERCAESHFDPILVRSAIKVFSELPLFPPQSWIKPFS